MHGQGRQEFSQYRVHHFRGRQDQTHRCVFRRHLPGRGVCQAKRKLIRSFLMSLTLHFHPLSSFCHKVLIALYENDTPFAPNIVNLQDEAERAALCKLWPIGKFPVLEDHARDWSVSESSIIIEYLDQQYPGKTRLVPEDADLARQM